MHQLGMKASIRSAEEFFLYLVLLKTQSVKFADGQCPMNRTKEILYFWEKNLDGQFYGASEINVAA